MAKTKKQNEQEIIEAIEVVKGATEAPPNSEVPVLPQMKFIINGIELNKEDLIQKRDRYLQLEIKGIEDRKGYEAVREAVAELRTARTTLEKVRKEEDRPIREYLDKRKELEDELSAICQEGEKALKAKMKEVDEDKEKKKQEEEQSRIDELNRRKNLLTLLGYQFDEARYLLNLPDKSDVINFHKVEFATPEEFEELLNEAEINSESYTKRKKDQEAEEAKVKKELEDKNREIEELKNKLKNQEPQEQSLFRKDAEQEVEQGIVNGIHSGSPNSKGNGLIDGIKQGTTIAPTEEVKDKPQSKSEEFMQWVEETYKLESVFAQASKTMKRAKPMDYSQLRSIFIAKLKELYEID